MVEAGYAGDDGLALAGLADESPLVRAAAFAALVRMGRTTSEAVANAFSDPAPTVRRQAAELAAKLDGADVAPLLEDADAGVVEAACFAAGEQEDAGAVSALCRIATSHGDALCRESAVAALGAIADPAGLPAILAGLSDKPAVRRRAVIALAPFEGPEVEEALRGALGDRDWQVRQAAEDLLRPEPGPEGGSEQR